MPFTDHAICLRRTDFSETSLVLRMMTRTHGQAALIAKGVKRPKSRFGGSIDLLAVGQAVFTLPRECSASTMGILTAWEQTAVYPRLRTDLLRHAAAMTAGELLSRLTEELDPHPASFDAILRLLDALGVGEPPIRRLAQFGRSLLIDVGLSPGLDRCVGCGAEIGATGIGGRGSGAGSSTGRQRDGETRISNDGVMGRWAGGADERNSPPAVPPVAPALTFSGRRGGLLCPACRPAPGESIMAISPNLKGFFMDGQVSSGKLALEIIHWLVYHVQHQIGRPLNSAAGLERAIQAALAGLPKRSQAGNLYAPDRTADS